MARILQRRPLTWRKMGWVRVMMCATRLRLHQTTSEGEQSMDALDAKQTGHSSAENREMRHWIEEMPTTDFTLPVMAHS